MSELKEAVTSKRLHACTVAEIPGGGTQASLLTVDDLCGLHTILRERWLQVRKSLSVAEPHDHLLMPVPSVQSAPTMRPLSASETGRWLRKILFGEKERLPGRRVPAHSMKATMLSLAAKFGLDAETKLQWAYHVGGFKLLHTCSRDAAAQPLLQLESVLKAIREETLRPDSMRSGRFVCQPVEKEPELSSFTVMDLTAEVELSGVIQEETQISEEAASSSSAESEETFPKSQSGLFRPPTPLNGYVLWQYRKLGTLHLALPEYKRVSCATG